MNDYGDKLITNFPKEEISIYREAIRLYGCDRLYIAKDAYWKNGYQDDNFFALRCTERRDLTEFWDILNRLKIVNDYLD